MEDELEKPIGTKEKQRLLAGSVIVEDVTIAERPTKKGGKVKIVNFHCNHPDADELIVLSNVKIKLTQGNNETIKKDALWYHLDEDQNIRKDSNVAILLKYYKRDNLKQFIHTAITTEADAEGYLCIKAY